MKKSLFNALSEALDPGQTGGSLFAGEGTALTPSTFLPGAGQSAARETMERSALALAPAARTARSKGALQLSRAGHTARGTA